MNFDPILLCELRKIAPSRNGLRSHLSRLYAKVYNAIGRCTNELNKRYSDYGGRGIKIHAPWMDDPTTFIAYLASLDGWNNPSLILDRIDNDGHYEPGNIRFTSIELSAHNRRPRSPNRIKNSFCGEHKSLRWWSRVQDPHLNVSTVLDTHEMLRTLDARSRLVLERRYFDNRTLDEIGAELRLTRERVRQIERRALRKLRYRFNGDSNGDDLRCARATKIRDECG